MLFWEPENVTWVTLLYCRKFHHVPCAQCECSDIFSYFSLTLFASYSPKFWDPNVGSSRFLVLGDDPLLERTSRGPQTHCLRDGTWKDKLIIVPGDRQGSEDLDSFH